MMEVVFVVLHFNETDATKKCIESLRKFNSKIVCVCNGSANSSDTIVYKYFEKDKDVRVLVNERNLGFAKGMNLGIAFAQKEYSPELVVCLNNDTIVDQKDFLKILLKEYQTDKFCVAGPEIRNTNGSLIKPFITDIPTKENIEKIIIRYKRGLSTFGLLWSLMYKVRDRLDIVHFKNGGLFVLNGSCMIFSRFFLEKTGGFNPDTFMYGEEMIISYMCYKNKLPIKYIDELKILHIGSLSTKNELQKYSKKRRFYYENMINSMNVLRNLID